MVPPLPPRSSRTSGSAPGRAPGPPVAGGARRGDRAPRRGARSRRAPLARVAARGHGRRRAETPPAFSLRRRVRRRLSLARLHRLLPPRRPASAGGRDVLAPGARALARPPRVDRGRPDRELPRRRTCSSPCPIGSRGSFRPATRCCSAPAFLLGAPMLVGPLLAAALVPATWFLARELAVGAGEDEARAEWIGADRRRRSRSSRRRCDTTRPSRCRRARPRPRSPSRWRARCARGRTGDARLFARGGPRPRVPARHAAACRRSARASRSSPLALLSRGRASRRPPTSRLGVRGGAAGPRAPARREPRRRRARLRVAGLLTTSRAFGPASPHASHFGARAAAMAALRRLRSNLGRRGELRAHRAPAAAAAPARRATPGRARRAAGGRDRRAADLRGGARPAPARARSSAPGASALADVLPLEHALIALALALALPRAWLGPVATATVALALAGFASTRPTSTRGMAAGGLGRPHYEPDVAREAGATHGLLFFDDDEGYELAHDPGATASHGLQAVRAARRRPRPPALRPPRPPPDPPARLRPQRPRGLVVDARTEATPGASRPRPTFPPVADVGPARRPRRGDRRAGDLRVGRPRPRARTRPAPAEASVTLELPVPRGASPAPRRTWMVTPRVFQRGGPGTGEVALVASLGRPAARPVVVDGRDPGAPLVQRPAGQARRAGRRRTRAWLVVTARGGAGGARQDDAEGSLSRASHRLPG